jgi:hypothetical protein
MAQILSSAFNSDKRVCFSEKIDKRSVEPNRIVSLGCMKPYPVKPFEIIQSKNIGLMFYFLK